MFATCIVTSIDSILIGSGYRKQINYCWAAGSLIEGIGYREGFLALCTDGFGVGSRLVDECIAFAKRAGYRKLTLWTNSVLHSARHIYVRAGFRKVSEEKHDSFGHDLVGQTWELTL